MRKPTKAVRGVYRSFWLAVLLLPLAARGDAARLVAAQGKAASRAAGGPTRFQTLGHAAITAGEAADSPRPAKAPLLTHIAEVRQLSPSQASQLIPVQARGVVTDMPGYQNSFFFQDGTAGISVDRTDHAEVHVGDRVEVTGTSGPGQFAPVVLASQVRVIGHGPPPHAPLKTLGDLFGGLEDSQWIELRGVVRAAYDAELFSRPILILTLQLDGGSVNLQMQDFAGIDKERIVDAVVRVRGVCASSGNAKRQFVGSTLLVPHRTDLQVEQRAPLDPFAGTIRPVGDVLKLGKWEHRVHVAGVVTYQVPGTALYLQDGNDGIRVESQSPVIAVPGTRVEASGFLALGEYAPILVNGLIRITGTGERVVPEPIKAADIITWRDGANRSNYDQQLVQMEARLVEDHIQGKQHLFLLRQGNETFEAHLFLSGSAKSQATLPIGSLLRLTGICTVQIGSTLNPISFDLLLRSPDDIVVLQRGPWWTPDRSLSLLALLAGVTLLTFLWVAALRHRVEQQTRAIRDSEERFRYLAEHDGLTGILNRSAVLVALDRQLARACREHKTVTVVLGDIDHFKQVNDVYGHLAGDAALRCFTEAASNSIRPYDSLGRYGGEEFLLVLPGIPEHDVEARLARLHGDVSNLTVTYQQARFSITCSLGAVMVTDCDEGVEPGMLLAAADRALYRAKDAGRNRVVLQQERVGASTLSGVGAAS